MLILDFQGNSFGLRFNVFSLQALGIDGHNQVSIFKKLVISIVCGFIVSACHARDHCVIYKGMLENEATVELLAKWADREIFSHRFSRSDFKSFDEFVGPGKGGTDFDLKTSGIEVPSIIHGYTIRSVGPDRDRPDVVFIGLRRYQGILIGRDVLSHELPKISGTPLHIEVERGRLGVICYTD